MIVTMQIMSFSMVI